MNALDVLADVADIVTALVAATAYGTYRITRSLQRRELESHLQKLRKSASFEFEARKTIAELATELGMSETEIFEAARRSNKLTRGLNNGSGDLPSRLWLSRNSN